MTNLRCDEFTVSCVALSFLKTFLFLDVPKVKVVLPVVKKATQDAFATFYLLNRPTTSSFSVYI